MRPSSLVPQGLAETPGQGPVGAPKAPPSTHFRAPLTAVKALSFFCAQVLIQ